MTGTPATQKFPTILELRMRGSNERRRRLTFTAKLCGCPPFGPRLQFRKTDCGRGPKGGQIRTSQRVADAEFAIRSRRFACCGRTGSRSRSEEHTSELQSRGHLV